jgi:hypothetical protein
VLACTPTGSSARTAAQVEVRLYGGAAELSGVGTMISGLRPAPPASVAADGMVASLNAGPVMVATPGIGEATLLPEASLASKALAVGLQAPVMIEVPKEGMAGGVAPGGSCGDSIPVVPTALLASAVVLGTATAIPLVGHVMIVPMALPGIGPKLPGLSWIAPNGLAPGVGIVPGAAAGDVIDTAGDVVRIAGGVRVVVDGACAKAELQPSDTMAALIRTRLRIGTSCA